MTCPFSSFENVISASFSLLENLVSVKGSKVDCILKCTQNVERWS
jgi:hypothetical protein